MKWKKINALEHIREIQEESQSNPVLIYKHSTRCNISRTALNRLERHWNETEMTSVKPYFLDLLTYREISNYMADIFEVEHESPQVLIIGDRKALYNASHFDIDYNRIKQSVAGFQLARRI